MLAVYINKKSKQLKVVSMIAAIFLFSACVPERDYTPSVNSRSSDYNANDLAKQWKNQFKKNQYPADNDSEYSYPVYKNYPPKPNPNSYPYIPPNPYANPPYPQDNDAGYVNPYPRYDPEADNSGFDYPLFFDD